MSGTLHFMVEYSIFRKLFSKFTLVSAALFLSASLLCAQETDIATVFSQIDDAFMMESSESLASILKVNATSPEYRRIEAYTLKKTRQLIIQDRLAFARVASLTLIDNNIENFDAIDLYGYIDKAMLTEESKRQADENRKRLEAERQAALAARTKEQIDRRGNYNSTTTSGGKSVYTSEQASSYSKVNWSLSIGLADVLYQKSTEPDYKSVKYGLGFGGRVFYETEDYVLGGEVFGDALVLTINGEEEFLMTGKLVPCFAFSPLSKHLFLRLGFGTEYLKSELLDTTGSVETFITPIVGLGIDNLTLGHSTVALHADYLLGCMMEERLNNAFEFGGSILLPVAVNERTKVGLELGVKDTLFMKKSGIENRCKGILAIGVGNVQK